MNPFIPTRLVESHQKGCVLCAILAPFCSAFLFVPFTGNNQSVNHCVRALESLEYVIRFATSPVSDMRMYGIFRFTALADRVATSPAPPSNSHLQSFLRMAAHRVLKIKT